MTYPSKAPADPETARKRLDEFVSLTAGVVAGLQVPASIGHQRALGAAWEPWTELLGIANGGFGWTNSDEALKSFRSWLGLENSL